MSLGFKMEVWKPNVLLLGSGGVKGFLMLGSLLFFEKSKMLKDIKKIVGISIGALIGLFYIVGYSITQILEIALMTDISDMINNIDILNIMKTNGLISHEVFRKRIQDKIIEKYGFVPTMKQLYFMTGYDFEIVVTNLDKNKAEYFSYITQPELSCVEAVLMSISLPLFFQTYVLKENIYLDGAISDPLPIERYKSEKVFGILMKASLINPKESFFNYLSSVLQSFTSTKERFIDVPINCKLLNLEYEINDIMGVKTSFEKKVDMFLFGYLRAFQFYQKLNESHPTEYPMFIQKYTPLEFFSSITAFKKQEDDEFILEYIEKLSEIDSEIMENEGDDYLMDLFEDSSSESSDWSSDSTDVQENQIESEEEVKIQSPHLRIEDNPSHPSSEQSEHEQISIQNEIHEMETENQENKHDATEHDATEQEDTEQEATEQEDTEQEATEQEATEQEATEQEDETQEATEQEAEDDENTIIVREERRSSLDRSKYSPSRISGKIYSPKKFMGSMKKWKKNKKKHKKPEWIVKK
jgi:predicted acylesterase/phospholipase RssA